MRKSIFKTIIVLIAAMAISFMFSGCSKDASSKITVKGSTTVLPITQKAAEDFYDKHKIGVSISGSGSGNGIKALLDKSTDIAMASRAMKDKELKAAKEKGIKTKEITVALDMIVPVVHPDNPVKKLSMDQLKAIYDGSISNWKKVGGKDEKIVVISRDTSSGTYEVWGKLVLKKADVRNDALLQASNGAVASAVTKNPKAIGYVGFGYLDDSLQAINVNGVKATIKSGKSGKYPISRALYLYVDEENLSADAQKFIDYLLSDEGQKIVKEIGFLPL
ncbi:MAG: PstS family phosphate ABC transporter substrate-binding protein [Spirochaetota bacterium]